MAQRVHYRKHNHYNTKSNKVRPIRTPGGKLTIHVIKKKAGKPKCADCKNPMQGVKALRPADNQRARKKDRKVSRAYGGSICAKCIKERIMRAFLFEEQKCVRQVLKEKKKQEQKVKKVKKEKKDKKEKADKKDKKKVIAKDAKKKVPSSTKNFKKVGDKKKGGK
ncbi:60S ribosomal protein L34, putative [Plasmodium chabaudi chabaudi]|uniref:Large ribosomal subunit protein eL34 n=2 Tax=Plasmodium chabaudi TaxID=5825 RepID=A0A077TRH1_PLACU|nr:60S ribosomal protein L34, putative [Plasmodium chabaudi chabaudi]SCM23129.1 60S ribosomal protein L34, putative [Plasmodium chabaudi adami]SCM24805.1 60S ribosomal protein L34, putative [Plasmodium chabaudi chabaudi]SCN62086.1 60S ribosomal protein L34, putative [Plasmodium chabaudi chabaudi]SCN62087.1 60S ribosomal protein L34, putative [Plasmodium chabaudi adami]VTZ69690.1 60S ribosomal protein L34, putative [Plasmodium chabaudi chabaudi]|eukprot:XP_740230.2 60S ribosomal protein L34a, putative [Plasmodium chabaudi chabaudi]